MIALDLDRTTLDKEGNLSAANRAAIQACIDRGIIVIVASGRSYRSLPEQVLRIPGIRYIISSNGAAMYEKDNSNPLRQFFLSQEDVDRVLELVRGEDVTFEGFLNGTPYAQRSLLEDPVKFGATKEAIDYVRRTRVPVEDIRAFLHEHHGEQEAVDIVVGSEDKKREIMELLARELPSVYITSSVQRLIEISNRNCGKQNGLLFFMEKLGIAPEEVVAFGDADNDLEMLELAGIGIAVDNAGERVKAVADYVTLSHDNDGVAYALREILHLI